MRWGFSAVLGEIQLINYTHLPNLQMAIFKGGGMCWGFGRGLGHMESHKYSPSLPVHCTVKVVHRGG